MPAIPFLRTLGRFALVLLTFFGPAAPAAEGPSAGNPPAGLVSADWTPPLLPQGWEVRGGPAIHVYGHVDDDRLLERLRRHADEAVPRLAKELGVPIGDDVHILLARSAEEFAALQPGSPPFWADGTAYPLPGAVFLRHPSLRGGHARPLEQVLDHELVHVLLGRAFYPVEVPRWLQEGVAQVYAGEAGPELPARIQRGALGGDLFSLAALERGFPADARRADLAYAQSADFVQWLRVNWGADAVRQLVLHARQGRSLAHAVRAVTGRSLAEIDAAWRERLAATTPVFAAPENLDAVLFGLGGVVLLGVGFARRRALSRRLGSWRTHDRALERLAREVLLDRAVRRP